ncbi:MAG: UvrD-helicase domain-containing protein [Magnetococcus sp. DMHC-6]
MVLAGAGSGKTRVLTRRLAYLMDHRHIRPGEILAVTFTNKAAREMRERVIGLLGLTEDQIQHLWIGTFHGIGARILRIDGLRLGYDTHFSILDADEQLSLIKRITKEKDFNDTYWTPKRLANSFSRWKDDGLTPERLGDKQIRFSHDRVRIASLFSLYQTALKRSNAMDFGDLLVNCLELWRQNPDILEKYQQRFRYLLVDEFQDTNHTQYQWLQYLTGIHKNLCVVGDDDQSIYSWRGAKLDNILRFEDAFPGTKIIRLEQNYRSTAHILQAASHLITHNSGRMGKTLWTEGEAGPRLQKYTAEDGEDEARWVTGEIRSHCDGHYERAAILVRAAWQTRAFEDALNRSLVPYHVVGGLKFMERTEVKDAICYLRLAYSGRDDLAFERIFNVPSRGLGPAAIQAIRRGAVESSSDGSLLAGAIWVLENKAIGKAALGHLHEFIHLIQTAAAQLQSETPPGHVLNFLLKESHYLDALEGIEREEEKRDNLRELHSLLEGESSLVSFLERAVLESDLGSDQKERSSLSQVTISTLHAAKGLEFPFVFLVGMEEGLLPHKLAMEEESGIEEERRLTYVGMTRAKEKLFLSHANYRRMFQNTETALPSRFLREIPSATLETKGLKVSAHRGLGAPPSFRARSRWK